MTKSRESAVAKARDVLLGEWDAAHGCERAARALDAANLLATDEMRACAEACAALRRTLGLEYLTNEIRVAWRAGDAWIESQRVEPRAAAMLSMANTWDVRLGGELVAEFRGPDAEERAKADAARLNEREGK